MPANKETKINLLPQKEFEKSILGRVLKWALSTFRIIVIATEMFVMMAFLSRFWLDARNSDLNDQITQKKAVILSFSDVEKNFRLFQQRLDIFSKISSEHLHSDYLETVVSLLPPDVILNGISNSSGSIQIVGVSSSEQGVAQFITNLKGSKKFSSVDLPQITSSKENSASLVFTIKSTLGGS